MTRMKVKRYPRKVSRLLGRKKVMGKAVKNHLGKHARPRIQRILRLLIALMFPKVIKRNQGQRARPRHRLRRRHPRKLPQRHPERESLSQPVLAAAVLLMLQLMPQLMLLPRSLSPSVERAGWLLRRLLVARVLGVSILKILEVPSGVRFPISGSQGSPDWLAMISHHSYFRRLRCLATTPDQGLLLAWELKRRITRCVPSWSTTISPSISKMSATLVWPWSVQLWLFLVLWCQIRMK